MSVRHSIAHDVSGHTAKSNNALILCNECYVYHKNECVIFEERTSENSPKTNFSTLSISLRPRRICQKR